MIVLSMKSTFVVAEKERMAVTHEGDSVSEI